MSLNSINGHVSSPELSSFFATKFSSKDEKIKVNSYDYHGVSLSSLALKAKVSQDAKNTLANAMQNEINTHAKTFISKKSYHDYNEVKSKLYLTLLQAIKIYDPSKGKFINLFRKMATRTLKFYNKERALKYTRDLKYFGNKLKRFDTIYYLDDKHLINGLQRERINCKVDLDRYMSKCSDEDKCILKMYQSGLTFKEIGNNLNLPLSRVTYKFYNMLSDLKRIFI